MIKLARHNKRKLCDARLLQERIEYLVDSDDPQHHCKTLTPARNHFCHDQDPDTFKKEILRRRSAYRAWREERRLEGKRTQRLWGELIFSSIVGAFLCEKEREVVEQAIVEQFKAVPCRSAWHIDEISGRADFHLLHGAHTNDDPPSVFYSTHFGGGKPSFHVTFRRLEEDLYTRLNRQRTERKQLKTTRQVAIANATKLFKKAGIQKKSVLEQIASLLVRVNWSRQVENLNTLLKAEGFELARYSDTSISLRPPGEKKNTRAIRFPIPKILSAFDLAVWDRLHDERIATCIPKDAYDLVGPNGFQNNNSALAAVEKDEQQTNSQRLTGLLITDVFHSPDSAVQPTPCGEAVDFADQEVTYKTSPSIPRRCPK